MAPLSFSGPVFKTISNFRQCREALKVKFGPLQRGQHKAYRTCKRYSSPQNKAYVKFEQLTGSARGVFWSPYDSPTEAKGNIAIEFNGSRGRSLGHYPKPAEVNGHLTFVLCAWGKTKQTNKKKPSSKWALY